MKHFVVLALAFVFNASLAGAQQKPRVPVGIDPRGVRVAIIGTGVDYTVFSLAQRLARDGEGTLIGADFEAQDFLPFEPSGARPGTALARALTIARPEVVLVAIKLPVLVSVDDAVQMVLKALTFPPVARARIGLVQASATAPTCRDTTLEKPGGFGMAGAVMTLQQMAFTLAAKGAAPAVPLAVPLVVIAPCPLADGATTGRIYIVGARDVAPAEGLATFDVAIGVRDPGVTAEDQAALTVVRRALAVLKNKPQMSTADLRDALVALTVPQTGTPHRLLKD